MNTIYEPSFTNPTVKRRLLKIEDYAFKSLKDTSIPVEMHHDVLEDIFGPRCSRLSGYLTDILLTRHGQYIPGEKSFQYTFNWVEFLKMQHKSKLITDKNLTELSIPLTIISSSRAISTSQKKIIQLFELKWMRYNERDMLKGNAKYTTCEKTARLLSPWQNISKEVKNIFFNGWWDYDIKSCAYTLLWQKFQKDVLPWWGHSKMKYEVLPRIAETPDEMRELLAAELNVPVPVMKKLLVNLLFGNNLTFNNPFVGPYKIIEEYTDLNPYEIHELALKSELITQLKLEIKDMWNKFITYWNNTNNKVGRKIFRTRFSNRSRPSAHRSRIYFELEKEVRDVLLVFMKKDLKIRIIHVIHDGFILKYKLVQINEAITEVKNKIGYQIQLTEIQLL